MSFLEIIGWFVFGYLMFQLLSAWVAMQHIKHAVQGVIAEREQKLAIANQAKSIRFERVVQGPYDVILAFGEDNKFILQGNTTSEVKKLLAEKYPEKTLLIHGEKVDESIRTQGKITSMAD